MLNVFALINDVMHLNNGKTMKHLLKQALILTVGVLAPATSYAGSANAVFDCQSASGRTALTASVPGDQAEHLVKWTVDKETVEWKNVIIQEPPYKSDKNSSVFVLGSMKMNNYHFLITKPSTDQSSAIEVFRFSAVPSSIDVKKTANGERGQLSAIIGGRDPRADKNGKVSPRIVVNCTYTYEI